MAEIVGGLFGVTPESLMAQREAALQDQAAKYAQLSPMQAAQAGFYTAGNRLAGVAGGLLGAQDPEMAKAATLQGILKGADTTSAEGLGALARTLASQGFGQQAMQVAQQAQGMREKESVITKNMRERAAADPVQQLIRTGKYTTGSVAAYEKSGNIADLEPIDKGDPTALTETADGVFLVNKTTGEKISRVGGAPQRGTNVSLSPEIKMANQELDWRKQFLTENKPVVEQGANVRQSLNLLGQTNSPFAQAAFNNTVVSALGGDKQKSNAEIKRLSNTGDVGTRIANTLTNFLEGKNTATTVQDQQDVLNALDKYLSIRYTSSSKGWENRLKQAKVDPSMVVPSYEEVVGTKSAGGQTVNYQGAPASIVAQNADGTIVIEQNGVRKTLAPKKQ